VTVRRSTYTGGAGFEVMVLDQVGEVRARGRRGLERADGRDA
jgi:glycine cleavage system aminomethyltransferase T